MLKKAALLLLLLVISPFSYASSINEPGFTESLLATIASGSSQYGGVTQDSAGNVYTAAATTEVFKVTPGGAVSQFGSTGVSDMILGLLVQGSTLFIGFESGNVYTMDLNQVAPNAVYLATLGSGTDAMGMTIAPAGFGSLGGQLVIGTEHGVSVVNQANGAVTHLINTSPTQHPHSDIAFTNDGTLLATDYNNNQIVNVDSNGTSSLFYSGPTSPEGIAVHPVTGDIYVASASSQTLTKIASDGQSSSTFATGFAFSGGWFMTGMRFSADSTTLTYLSDSSPAIYQISGFPESGGSIDAVETEPVPVVGNAGLAILTMLMLVGALFGFRRFS